MGKLHRKHQDQEKWGRGGMDRNRNKITMLEKIKNALKSKCDRCGCKTYIWNLYDTAPYHILSLISDIFTF